MMRFSFFTILVFLGLASQCFAFTDTIAEGEKDIAREVQGNIDLLNVDHMDMFPSIRNENTMKNLEQASLTDVRFLKKKKRPGPRRGGRPGPRRGGRPGPRRGRPGPRRGGPGPRRGGPGPRRGGPGPRRGGPFDD